MSINGQMIDNSLVIGSIIKCMEKAYSLGQMVESMKVNIKMIINTVTGYFIGQIRENMMGIGKTVNSKELAYLPQLKKKPNMENGLQVKDYAGLKKMNMRLR